MTIPTEPIGSIPRPPGLLAAMAGHERGEISDTALAAAQDEAKIAARVEGTALAAQQLGL
jgi:methionine synthase II (cobalamin-independent)